MGNEIIGVILRGRDESLGRTLKAGREELMATDRAINSTSAAFDENTNAQGRTSAALRQTKQDIIGTHRNVALMPASVQALNGTMIELAITLGSLSAIASPFILLTKQTVEYNSMLERNRLGIASVITAVGQLHNAEGELLTGRDALNSASVMALDLQKRLQSDALTTAATFSDLADAFQVAIGPGLQAGLSLPEIEKFTVRIAQAAAAIGVPMNQLAEEVRSILSGTITKDSRIATVLGIDDKDVNQAKRNVGGLAAFLDEKFSAFGEAGQVAATQWDALWANTLAAAQRAIGEGMPQLFDALKGDLQSVFDALVEVERNSAGVAISTKIRPEVLESFKALGEGIHYAIEGLKFLVAAAKTATDTVGLGGIAIALFGLRGLLKKNADGVRAFSGVIAASTVATEKWTTFTNSAGYTCIRLGESAVTSSKGVAILSGTIKTLMRTLWPLLALEGGMWLYDFFKSGADGVSNFEKALRSAQDKQDNFLAGYQRVGDITANRVSAVGGDGFYNRIFGGDRLYKDEGSKAGLTFGAAFKQSVKDGGVGELLSGIYIGPPKPKPKFGGGDTVSVPQPGSGEGPEAAKNAKELQSARDYLAERAKLFETARADELTKTLADINIREKHEKQALDDKLQVLRDQKISEADIQQAKADALRGIDAQYNADREAARQANADKASAEAAKNAKELQSARDYLAERARIVDTAWADELTKTLADINIREKHEKQALDDKLQVLRDQKISEADIQQAKADALRGIDAQYNADRMAAYQADADRRMAIDDEEHQRRLDKQQEFYDSSLALQSNFGDLFAGNTRVHLKGMTTDLIKFGRAARKIDKSTWEGKLNFASSALGMLSSLMNSKSREMFEVGKAAAIGQAIIDGIAGATRAFRELPFPVAVGASAVIAAAAAANVAQIASTPFGGGGGAITAGAAGGGGFSAAPSAPTSITPEAVQVQGAQINVTLNALDPSSVTDQVLRGIGERLAPVIQSNFDRNTQMQVTA